MEPGKKTKKKNEDLQGESRTGVCEKIFWS